MNKLLLVTVLLASCQVPISRPAETAKVDLPATFAAASKGQNKAITVGWLKSLNDPALSRIVREALANNPNLKVAATNLKSARQGVIIGRAARLPSVSASSNASYGGIDGDFDDSYSLSLNANWEADLWGRLRDLEEASYADYEVAISDFRGARLSLAINAAQSWCNLITAENQLMLARQTLASFRENFRIIERGYQAGILRALDVNFGRNNIAGAEGNLRSSELARNEAARSLEVLLGRYPDASTSALSELPDVPAELQAGIPSQLLERRPDLTARKALIFASAKRADASRKNLLPNLILSSSNGTSSPRLQDLLNPNLLASSIAASVSQALYTGGQETAQARQAVLANEVQIQTYVQEILQAVQEVESALDTASALREQETFLEKERLQASLAEKFAEDELLLGTSDRSATQVLELLEAQSRAVSARAALISLRNLKIQNHLDLLLALGGTI